MKDKQANWNTRTLFLLFLVIACINFHGLAFSTFVLRDAETEHALNKIAEPIMRAASIKGSIRVIANRDANAFTDGSNRLFLHSGLITKYPDVDILRAVVAHEIGHIKAQHVPLRKIGMDSVLPTMLSGAIIGAAVNPILGVFGALLGIHTSSRDILKYSRACESQADLLAMEYLKKSGHTSLGLKNFLISLKGHTAQDLQGYEPGRGDKYDLTHPLYIERISQVESFIQKSGYTHKKENDSQLIRLYERVIAKLRVFTEDNPIFVDLGAEAQKYGAALTHAKRSRKEQALNEINAVLQTNPKDPFVLATKAEILAKFGENNSIGCYKQATQLAPRESLIQEELGYATITFSQNDNSIRDAIQFLEMALLGEPHNVSAMQYLSYAYDKLGKKGDSLFYTGLAKYHAGEQIQAKKILTQSLRYLSANSVHALKVRDIIGGYR